MKSRARVTAVEEVVLRKRPSQVVGYKVTFTHGLGEVGAMFVSPTFPPSVGDTIDVNDRGIELTGSWPTQERPVGVEQTIVLDTIQYRDDLHKVRSRRTLGDFVVRVLEALFAR